MKQRCVKDFEIYIDKKIKHDEEILKVYRKVYKRLIEIGIPLCKGDIKKVGLYNTKSSRTFGITYKQNVFNMRHFYTEANYYVGINKKLHDKNNKVSIEGTMAHELIHTIDGCVEHNEKFKYYASIVNKYYPEYKVTKFIGTHEISKERINRAKYIITCEECGQKYYYLIKCRAVKEMNEYHCAICESKALKLEMV